MKRILIPVALGLFLCSTASAFQGGGGELTKKGSSKKKEATKKKTSETKSNNTTPPRPPAPPASNRPGDADAGQREVVVDYANVIDSDTRKKLESIYVNLKQRADIEFAVVTVDTTGDRDIFDYSLAVARRWRIGSKEGDVSTPKNRTIEK